MSLQRFCTLLSAFHQNIILKGQLEGNIILQEFNPIENNSNIMTKAERYYLNGQWFDMASILIYVAITRFSSLDV